MSFVDPKKTLTDMNIAEGMTVADFDAGAGFYTIALASRVGPYGMVYAVDSRLDLLTKISNEVKSMRFKNVKVIRGDVETRGGSGLSDSSVDRVVIANTLFCCDHPDRVVDEAVRILKRKGKIAVVDWAESFGHLGPHPDCLVKKDFVELWMDRAGMKLEKEIDTGDFHYGLVFKFKD